MSSNYNETLRAHSAESLPKLKTVHQRVLKLRLMVNALKGQIGSKNQNPQIDRALKVLYIAEYLELKTDNNKEQLLNLQDCEVNLSYTERKSVRELLVDKLRNDLIALAAFQEKLQKEMPELFSTDALADSPSARILALEAKRRSNMQEIAELRSQNCKYQKEAADLKLGSSIGNDLEVLRAQMRLDQTKVNVLRGFFTNELVNRTEHTQKALKEVEKYIERKLEDMDSEKSEIGRL